MTIKKKKEISLTSEYLNFHDEYCAKYGKDKTIVFMQKGKFYEAYATEERGPDLAGISKLLNIKCAREKSDQPITETNCYMVGFPTVAMTKYANILTEKGFTVPIIDQITLTPKVKRGLKEILSPGTYVEAEQIADTNYIVSVVIEEELQKGGKSLLSSGMAATDLTTGKVFFYEAYSSQVDDRYALDESSRFIHMLNPREIIITFKQKNISSNITKEQLLSYLELKDKQIIFKSGYDIDKKYDKLGYQEEFLKKIYSSITGMISPIECFGLSTYVYATTSILILLDFAYDHNPKIINNLSPPELYYDAKNLILGNDAVSQLSIVDPKMNLYKNSYRGIETLFDVVNNTSTVMGRRMLYEKLNSPYIDSEELNNMYDYVDDLVKDGNYRNIENILMQITDIERLERKMSVNMLQPPELFDLIDNYKRVIDLFDVCKKLKFVKKLLPEKNIISTLSDFIDECEHLFNGEALKAQNLADMSTNVFNKGIHEDVDEIQNKLFLGNNFLDKMCSVLSSYIPEPKHKNSNSKPKIVVRSNGRDGHYLSLTKIRCASLLNRLKDIEEINVNGYKLNAKDLKTDEENQNSMKITFPDIGTKSDEIEGNIKKMRELSIHYYQQTLTSLYNDATYKIIFKPIKYFVSIVDYIKSNAKSAVKYNYKRPTIIDNEEATSSMIDCKQLRHPIIERIIDFTYVPHDVSLGKENKGMLVYGLNSSGKSSIMKAVGLCIVMAQAGMFVPALSCNFTPYNALFTRITGNDDIIKGLSSYALEMLELKAILRRADPHTLVIGDEICRGTEYISGNSIVAATIIQLSKLNTCFIFATHLHEIVEMEKIKNLSNVKAFHLSVDYDPKTDSLIYDRKLKPGSGEKIYGITVAKSIIKDKEFIDLALEIKNELMASTGSLISGKTSRYNSGVFVHACQLCGKQETTGLVGTLQTHHINHQKDCKEPGEFSKENPHIQKNSKANLIVVCAECHDKIHHEGMDLEGYVMTSNGKQVVKKQVSPATVTISASRLGKQTASNK